MPKTTAPLIKETILVERSGNWGPQSNGVWYGLNEPLTATDFVVGKTYDVLVKQGAPTAKNPQGKKYISQIVGESTVGNSLENPVPMPSSSTKDLRKGPDGVAPKQRDFDAEARGKTRCALFGDALKSPALAGLQFTNITELVALVKTAADEGVKYTFQDK